MVCFAGSQLKHALVVVFLALAAACNPLAQSSPSDEPVDLLTGDAGGYTQWHANGVRSCLLLNIRGLLIVDEKYGTAIAFRLPVPRQPAIAASADDAAAPARSVE